MKKLILKTSLAVFTALLFALPTSAQTTPDQALGGAIFTKNLPMLLEALKNGADVNGKMPFIAQPPAAGYWTFEKGSPLLYAVSMDWYEGVLELLRAGAKVHYEEDVKTSGFTFVCQVIKVEKVNAMFLAKYYNNPDIAKVLIIKGADTKIICNAYFPSKCKQNYETKTIMLNLRNDVSEAFLAVLKEGKKAAWAQNGLPAEGQKP